MMSTRVAILFIPPNLSVLFNYTVHLINAKNALFSVDRSSFARYMPYGTKRNLGVACVRETRDESDAGGLRGTSGARRAAGAPLVVQTCTSRTSRTSRTCLTP